MKSLALVSKPVLFLVDIEGGDGRHSHQEQSKAADKVKEQFTHF